MTEHIECDIIHELCPTPEKDCHRCGVWIMNDMMEFMGMKATFVKADKDDVL